MPHRTVLQNVAYGLQVQGVAKEQREEKAEQWLETVGLGGYESSILHNFPVVSNNVWVLPAHCVQMLKFC